MNPGVAFGGVIICGMLPLCRFTVQGQVRVDAGQSPGANKTLPASGHFAGSSVSWRWLTLPAVGSSIPAPAGSIPGAKC
jgi:hypothetical protein